MLDMSLETKITSLPYLSFMDQQESKQDQKAAQTSIGQDQKLQQSKVAAFSSSCWKDHK